MNSKIILALAAVTLTGLTAPRAHGQNVDRFVWVTWILGVGAPCQICLFDGTGTNIAGFSFASLAGAPICKTPSGTVWAVNGGTGTTANAQIVPFTLAGAGAPVLAPNVGSVGCDALGGVWTSHGNAFAPPIQIVKRDAAGAPLTTFTLTGASFPAAPVGDPFGNVWIVDAGTGKFWKITPAGTVTGPYGANGGSAGCLKIDGAGNVWRLSQPSGAPVLRKYSNNATLLFSTTVTNATTMNMDVCGRPVILRTNPTTNVQTIDTLDNTSGAVVSSVVSPAASSFDGIAVDSAGRFWLSSTQSQNFAVVSTAGSLISFNNSGFPVVSFSCGDRTGVHAISTLAPNNDSDGDGFTNITEINVGSDALDPASVPRTLAFSTSTSSSTTVIPGSTFSLSLNVPQEAGFPFIIGAALSTPGIPLPAPDCRKIPLALDPVLDFWIGPVNFIATSPVAGVLSGAGFGAVSGFIPAGASLGGITAYFAGVTVNPVSGAVSSLTAPRPVIFN